MGVGPILPGMDRMFAAAHTDAYQASEVLIWVPGPISPISIFLPWVISWKFTWLALWAGCAYCTK